MKGYFTTFRLFAIFFGVLSIGCSNARNLTTGSDSVSVLTGDWVVISQTVSPLVIIPFCKPIQKETTFKFTQDKLEVYLGSSDKPCDAYRFKITANTISFIKEDMIWLCTYELNSNILKLKSDNFFTPDESNKSVTVNSQPTTRQAVVVTLSKKNTQNH
jgi:hypothetical protein